MLLTPPACAGGHVCEQAIAHWRAQLVPFFLAQVGAVDLDVGAVDLGFAAWPLREKYARIDVLPDGGHKAGVKSTGVKACLDACLLVKKEIPTRTVVDPFCGFGTVLAVANALGLDAVGVDIAARMCRQARELQVDIGEPG